jgi:hypothetical protein
MCSLCYPAHHRRLLRQPNEDINHALEKVAAVQVTIVVDEQVHQQLTVATHLHLARLWVHKTTAGFTFTNKRAPGKASSCELHEKQQPTAAVSSH